MSTVTTARPNYLRGYDEFSRPKADVVYLVDRLRSKIGEVIEEAGYRLGRRIAWGERTESLDEAFDAVYDSGFRQGLAEGCRRLPDPGEVYRAAQRYLPGAGVELTPENLAKFNLRLDDDGQPHFIRTEAAA